MTRKTNPSKSPRNIKKRVVKKTSKTVNKKGYSPLHPKKKIRANLAPATDPYISKEQLKDYTICTKCHIVYHLNRWFIDKNLYNALKNNRTIKKILCPACKKIKDNYAMGVVSIKGGFFFDHKEEILSLIKHEELRAMDTNPLERIMKKRKDKENYIITTTSEKLAQKIGRALHRAYKGEVRYSWSDNNKFVRVFWEREK
ncbi:ATPase [Candidatus Dependentiae bacterium]|nr:ATPase [Candidatus Dependentiae bacterium]